jgi:septum formation protein
VWWYPADVPIVLASRSPRRRTILEMAGIPFVQIPGDVEESPMNGAPAEVVRHWARLKAEDVLDRSGSRPVLGADTMVALDGHLLGKPEDEDHAFRMLTGLSGRWHSVFGGVSVLWPEKELELSFHEETRVRFRELGPEEILAYIRTGEPMDKAGAYGIQGYGCMLVESIQGCYFNVMGLPVARFVHSFRDRLMELELECRD